MDKTNPLSLLREIQLTDLEKRHIRDQINSKRSRYLRIRHVLHYLKFTSYATVAAFGVFVFATLFQPTSPDRMITSTSDELITMKMAGKNVAQADTIGRLIAMQGVVQVVKDGIISPSSDIVAGDLVIVQPGAEVIVQVREYTYVKITGPAKFILEKSLDQIHTYILNLLEGESLEFTTQPTPVAQTSLDSTTTPIIPDKVVIKTKYVEVTTTDTETTNVNISQKDETATVVAVEGTVIVKQLIAKDAENELVVAAGDIFVVDQYHAEVRVPTEPAQVAVLTQDTKELTINYTHPETADLPTTPSTDDALDTGEAIDVALLASLPTQPTGDAVADTSFLASLADQFLKDEKVVIQPEVLGKLQQTLHQQITKQNLDQMRQRKTEGNLNAFVIAYTNLLDQLNQAYKIVGLTQPAVSPTVDSLEAGARVATTLSASLRERFLVPPSLIQDITLIADGLRSLLALEIHPVADEPVLPEEAVAIVAETGAVIDPTIEVEVLK